MPACMSKSKSHSNQQEQQLLTGFIHSYKMGEHPTTSPKSNHNIPISLSPSVSELNSATSIRRTHSATNMSTTTTTWQSSSSSSSSFEGLIKRTTSSTHLDDDHQENVLPSSGGTAAFDEIWRSIEQRKTSNFIPPYVHPLMKRSTSSLSSKSLEICTESLGSETGSDHGLSLSSYLPSSDSENSASSDEDTIADQSTTTTTTAAAAVVTKTPTPAAKNIKKSLPIPPPLTSLVNRGLMSNHHLQMRSSRQDGRLVVEAISVQTQVNCFHAERQNGRLRLLAFSSDNNRMINDHPNEKETDQCEFHNYKDGDQLLFGMDDDDDDDKPPSNNTTMMMNCHKFIGLTRNSTSPRFNKTLTTSVDASKLKNDVIINGGIKPDISSHCQHQQQQRRPPRPPSSRLNINNIACTTFNNVYDYYWKKNNPTLRHITSATATVKDEVVMGIYIPDDHVGNGSNKGPGSQGDDHKNKQSVMMVRLVNNRKGGTKLSYIHDIEYPKHGGHYRHPAAPATTVNTGCGRRNLSVWREPYCCIATS